MIPLPVDEVFHLVVACSHAHDFVDNVQLVAVACCQGLGWWRLWVRVVRVVEFKLVNIYNRVDIGKPSRKL